MFLWFSETKIDFIICSLCIFNGFIILIIDTFLLFPGKFGTGIQSYFSFLRFLVLLNFIIFILMFSFVTLPTIISKYGLFNSTIAYISPKNTGKHLLYVQLF